MASRVLLSRRTTSLWTPSSLTGSRRFSTFQSSFDAAFKPAAASQASREDSRARATGARSEAPTHASHSRENRGNGSSAESGADSRAARTDSPLPRRRQIIRLSDGEPDKEVSEAGETAAQAKQIQQALEVVRPRPRGGNLSLRQGWSNVAREPSLRTMMMHGCHWASPVEKYNPWTAEFLIGERHGQHIIDLTRSLGALRRTVRMLQRIAQNEGTILFVGNSPESRSVVSAFAKDCECPYLTTRFVPGTLTNFNELMATHRGGRIVDTAGRRTPKPKLLNKSLLFRMLDCVPDCIVFLDPRGNDVAIQEAKQMRIPTVAVCSSHDSLKDLTYIIPGNNQSSQSVFLFMYAMSRAVREAKQTRRLSQNKWQSIRDSLAGSPAREASSPTRAAQG